MIVGVIWRQYHDTQAGRLLFVRSVNLKLHFALLQINTFHIVDLITQLLSHTSHNIINAMDALPYRVHKTILLIWVLTNFYFLPETFLTFTVVLVFWADNICTYTKTKISLLFVCIFINWLILRQDLNTIIKMTANNAGECGSW